MLIQLLAATRRNKAVLIHSFTQQPTSPILYAIQLKNGQTMDLRCLHPNYTKSIKRDTHKLTINNKTLHNTIRRHFN